jgi:hypothetical protein
MIFLGLLKWLMHRDEKRRLEALKHEHKSQVDFLDYYKLQNRCHAGRDGECNWKGCPQLRDGEPEKSGRHCPLDEDDDQ